MGLKQVALAGRLTRDPESRETKGGSKMVSFTVAVDSNRPSRGDDKPKSTFFRVTAFGKTAEAIQNHVGKGDEVLVSGDVELNVYENDGKTYSNIDVTADRVTFGRKAKSEQKSSGGSDRYGAEGGNDHPDWP